MRYKYVIWDWNGTLFNDVELGISIINKILKNNKLQPLTYNKYRNIFTFPVSDYYKIAGFDFNKTSFEILGKQFMDGYEANKYKFDLFEGARDVLNFVQKNGSRQSILSAYKHDTLIEILTHYNIIDFFDKIQGLDNIYAGSKEHLGIELRKHIPFKKEEVLFVGDTLHDADVAKVMDVDCVLISNGHQSPEILNVNGNKILSHIREVINFLE